jgi:DNA-binding winged helix-turn-helix (wHTH) protein
MRWRFGPFEVDLLEHQLRRGQRVVPVTRKSFALLAALLARPGSLVSKPELFETLWAGTVVTDAALSRAIRELRVALGDDAADPTYIATVHGLGFRFIAPMLNEAPAAPPSESAPYADWVVAREQELACLSRAAATARQGSCQMVFVSGEAGIGKTTLVESFIAAERARGELWVAQGRCIEQYGQREAYLPLREALEALSVQAGNDRLRDVLLRYAPAWLAQLPWLAHDADRKGPPSMQPSTTAQGMLREIAHALEVLAADRLVVLWLEDLHWSDYSTLDAIALLAGRSASAQLLVIGSYRPGDAHVSAAPLHAMVQRLVQRGQASDGRRRCSRRPSGATCALACAPHRRWRWTTWRSSSTAAPKATPCSRWPWWTTCCSTTGWSKPTPAGRWTVRSRS